MAYQAYPSIKGVTLGGSGIAEEYIPLWVYSSGTFSENNAGAGGGSCVPKGTTSGQISGAYTAHKLHTLSSSWSSSQKFALEASLWQKNAGYTTNLALYDITASAYVSGSTVATSSQNPTVIRSGSFNLTPGHVYGISLYPNMGSTNTAYLTKAHLVAIN